MKKYKEITYTQLRKICKLEPSDWSKNAKRFTEENQFFADGYWTAITEVMRALKITRRSRFLTNHLRGK